ncbi:MAG: phospholipase [Deltaproteobacteria bacterium]|jgi:phospholipase/carboxylesterase|nr:phospholipase [Deltaproteobacteria bacterium]
MRVEAKDNPDSSEKKLDSICNRLTAVLDGINVFQRRFFPPAFPELRKDLIAHRASLKQARQELGEAQPSTELSGPWETITVACDLMLDAIELMLAASISDFQDIVTRAMRSFRRFCRIQENLYPLRATSPSLNRFYLEPQFHERIAEYESAQSHRPGVGLQHVGVEDSYYARGALSVYVPESYDDTKAWALVIALHGGFGHGRDFIWTWLREARSREFILMAPTSIDTTWSLLAPELDGAAIISMLENVKKRWNIDAEHILLTGISDGATYALVTALQPGSSFTAFAPVAGVLPSMNLNAVKDKRIFWVHGALDWMFPVQSARTAVEMLESAGADVTLRVIDDLSHTYPREENNRILQWFEPGLALSE